jgi:hypothetical protein
MVNFPGRNGRRRRVLNEEVLSASSSHAALRAFAEEDPPRDAPRYSDAAGVEHHPQITDFVPRRYRTLMLLVLAGVVTATTGALLHYFAPTVAAGLGASEIAAFDCASPGNLFSWGEAITLLVSSVTCLLVYSIRRHRIDDIRGLYRVWLAVAAVCLVMSANSVTALHRAVSHSLGHVTGWTALREDAVWWLVLGGMPLAWIAVRALIDTLECRLATSLLIAAGLFYAGSAVSYFGIVSPTDARVESMTTGTAIFAGHWLVLVAIISYARFVILDAQGLVEARPHVARRKKNGAAPAGRRRAQSEQPADAAPTILSAVGYSRRQPAESQPSAKSHGAAAQWVDGSRRERDLYEDDAEEEATGDDRKLNKSERKRLRKLKSQNRAA